MRQLVASGTIKRAVFAVYLSSNEYSKPSNIILGGFDLDTYSAANEF
jgi:hypothetical protein